MKRSWPHTCGSWRYDIMTMKRSHNHICRRYAHPPRLELGPLLETPSHNEWYNQASTTDPQLYVVMTSHSKRRIGSESASRPLSEFWCLNDKMIKELITFAKCEIGKMSYKLHWNHSLFKTYVMAMIITYLCMPYDKKKSSNGKKEIELIIYVSCQLTP
jgi:hypothetical protein